MEKIKEYVSQADLNYSGINRISEAGMPIGNGRMGTIIWLTEAEMHMQINRVDLFACDSGTQSFPEMDTDYANGCGLIDISFGSMTESIFNDTTKQHLSVYNGKAYIDAGAIKINSYPIIDDDLFIIEITDMREKPKPMSVHIRTMRGGNVYIPGIRPQIHPSLQKAGTVSYIKTRNHLATSILNQFKDTVSLTQHFEEGSYYCCSNMIVKGIGRHCGVYNRNFSESVLEFSAGNGAFYVVIGTSQSFKKDDNKSHSLLDLSLCDIKPYINKSRIWWHDFWGKAPLMRLESSDGLAQQVGIHTVWFLYLMSCVSRGDYMARYGGLLFFTGGDYRMWGSQYWWHNQSCYYAPLVSMGCHELSEAFFKHIEKGMEAFQMAARQQWGSSGMFIPETCWFNGPEPVPDELINEMIALYTNKKPWSERSDAFCKFAEFRNVYESRWNWEIFESEEEREKFAPYSYVTHIFSTTAKVAWLFWVKYVQTGDIDWLREHAYPVLSKVADFYLNLPFITRGKDGKLHILRVNNHEDLWDANDTISELAAIHNIIPVAIRSAELLAIDSKKRHGWQNLIDNMVPIQTNRNISAVDPNFEGAEIWSSGLIPVRCGNESYYHSMDPINIYHYVTLETPPSPLKTLAENTYKHCLKLHGYGTESSSIGELDPFILSTARIGDAKAVEEYTVKLIRDVNPENFIDSSGIGNTVILDNRMTLREGAQAVGAQRLGQVAETMAYALCSAVPPCTAQEPVVHLFASLPEGWDAEFKLPAANGYWVEAKKSNGNIDKVVLFSGNDLPLSIRNPWGSEDVIVDYGDYKKVMQGEIFIIHGNCTLKELETEKCVSSMMP